MFRPLSHYRLRRIAAYADQRGVTAVEYALLLALISVVLIVALSGVGRASSHAFSREAVYYK